MNGEFVNATVESVTAAAAEAASKMPTGFPRFDHERTGKGCLSHLVIYMDPAL